MSDNDIIALLVIAELGIIVALIALCKQRKHLEKLEKLLTLRKHMDK